MMIELLTYDLKVAVLIAVFYMFYRLLLARETFHRVNRIVLLLTAVASFVLPLCVITLHETVVMESNGTVVLDGLTLGVADEEAPPLWQAVLPILYIIGVVTVLTRMLLAIGRVLLLIRRSEQYPQADGSVIAVTDKQLPPFSFFSTIVLSQKDYEEQNAAILTHERGHIRQRHSLDVILVDTLTALQWFNPAMWMLRQDLRQIHEYEADAAVLSCGINARQYQYLLVSKAAGIGGYSIANGISHSTLKNRISMMQNNNSNRRSLLKLLAIIPIVGSALVLNAETVQDVVYTDTPQQKIVKKGRANQTVKVGNQEIKVVEQDDPKTTFDVVEQMPEFPGGMPALMQFLNENVRYPKAAEDAQQEGRVIATFIVEKDGAISEPRVVKSVSPELDAEAIRVISAMPNWTPGKQSGKLVRVKYTIPISFKLQGETKKADSQSENVATGSWESFERAAIEIDGKSAKPEDLEAIDPKNIEKMEVKKNDDGTKKIIVTTKKK